MGNRNGKQPGCCDTTPPATTDCCNQCPGLDIPESVEVTISGVTAGTTGCSCDGINGTYITALNSGNCLFETRCGYSETPIANGCDTAAGDTWSYLFQYSFGNVVFNIDHNGSGGWNLDHTSSHSTNTSCNQTVSFTSDDRTTDGFSALCSSSGATVTVTPV